MNEAQSTEIFPTLGYHVVKSRSASGFLEKYGAKTLLTELKNARQVAGERRRRWFGSSEMDLIVWYDESDSIARFELYYDKTAREHVFIWGGGQAFYHLAVDDGEQKPVIEYKEAPILVPDGHVDYGRIARLFERACENLPDELISLVRGKLGQSADS